MFDKIDRGGIAAAERAARPRCVALLNHRKRAALAPEIFDGAAAFDRDVFESDVRAGNVEHGAFFQRNGRRVRERVPVFETDGNRAVVGNFGIINELCADGHGAGVSGIFLRENNFSAAHSLRIDAHRGAAGKRSIDDERSRAAETITAARVLRERSRVAHGLARNGAERDCFRRKIDACGRIFRKRENARRSIRQRLQHVGVGAVAEAHHVPVLNFERGFSERGGIFVIEKIIDAAEDDFSGKIVARVGEKNRAARNFVADDERSRSRELGKHFQRAASAAEKPLICGIRRELEI